MKFKDMVRFTPERQNGQVTSRLLTPTERIVAAVNDKPGISAPELAYLTNQPLSIVSGRLTGMANAKKPKIKSIKQDGKRRFYPTNWKLSTDPRPMTKEAFDDVLSKAAQPKKPTKPKDDLEALLKEYVWQTGADPAPLKDFIAWRRTNG